MCIFEELTMVVHFWRTYFGLPDQAKLIKYTPHCGKGYEAVAALCQLDYLEIERLNVQTDLNLINFSRESKKTRKKKRGGRHGRMSRWKFPVNIAKFCKRRSWTIQKFDIFSEINDSIYLFLTLIQQQIYVLQFNQIQNFPQKYVLYKSYFCNNN